MELASCHISGTSNLKVVPRFLKWIVWGSNLGGDNRYYLVENVQTECWVHAASNSVGTKVLS